MKCESKWERDVRYTGANKKRIEKKRLLQEETRCIETEIDTGERYEMHRIEGCDDR